jgi:hypothetical protein
MILFTREEAAARFKLSPRTLEKWALKGKGPEYCKLNGSVRYTEDQLEAWIDSCRRKSTTEAQ